MRRRADLQPRPLRQMIPARLARRLSFLLVLFILPAPVARSKDNSFPCTVDRIDGAFVTGGYVVFTGWAADPSQGAPVRKIEVFLDGRVPGESQLGGSRPDVLAHFKRPDYLWAGWSGTLSLKGVSAGTHFVEAIAVSSGGTRVACGGQEIQVKDSPRPPERPAFWVAGQILLRAAALLVWLVIVGLAPALIFRTTPVLLSSPLIGLALFAIVAETGSALHVRPLYSAAVLTFLSGAAGVILYRRRRPRTMRWTPTTVGTLAFAAAFALIGVIPLASHGEGAVLGDIDDGIRECAVADSILQHGWRLPADLYSYQNIVRWEMDAGHARRGGIHLLAALAQAFGARAHEIHSVAMLAAGFLVVVGSGLLAVRVLRPFPKTRWIAPGLVALNSILVATLYGQHLGSLLGAALLLLFLTEGLRVVRARRPDVFVAAALPIAAGWSLYPEAMPLWALAAVFLMMIPATFRRRKRAAARFVLALVVSAALNPVGLSLVARSSARRTREPVLSTPYSRSNLGDTHYFPSPAVIAGITPYRLDAPAPIGRLRSVLIPVAGVLIVLVSLLGWSRLAAVEKRLTLSLVGPIVLGLYANRQLEFPYGYAKFLVLAAPLWAITFVLLAFGAGGGVALGTTWRRAAAVVTLSLVAILSLASVRHVVNGARRWIPSWDPAFRSLPALARVAGPDAVMRIEEYPGARRRWMLYFLSEHEVDLSAEGDRSRRVPYFQIVDRRRLPDNLLPAGAIASSRDFCIVPLAGLAGPGS